MRGGYTGKKRQGETLIDHPAEAVQRGEGVGRVIELQFEVLVVFDYDPARAKVLIGRVVVGSVADGRQSRHDVVDRVGGSAPVVDFAAAGVGHPIRTEVLGDPPGCLQPGLFTVQALTADPRL